MTGDDEIRRLMAEAAELMRDDPFRVARVEARARRSGVRRRLVAASGATVALVATVMSVQAVATGRLPITVGSGEAGLPDVAVVTCDGTTAKTTTRAVRARPDGVHVRVTNTAQGTLEAFYPGGSVVVPPGESRVAIAGAPPGPLAVDCFDPTSSLPHVTTTIDVRDPDGHHKPIPRKCVGGVVTYPLHEPDPQLPDVQEREIWGAEARISHLRYLHPQSRTVLVEEDGVYFVARWSRGDSGWKRDSVTTCR